MNINKAIIIGRITQDLELKALPNGNSVLNFSVATNRVYIDQNNNKVEQTEFHNIVSFGKQAENISRFFVKGQEIYIEGRLQTRNWEDKDCGKKMYRTEIVVDKFDFGAKPNGFNGSQNSNYQQNQTQPQSNFNSMENSVSNNEIEYPTDDVNPEDIPF